jgi:hypothetical protein
MRKWRRSRVDIFSLRRAISTAAAQFLSLRSVSLPPSPIVVCDGATSTSTPCWHYMRGTGGGAASTARPEWKGEHGHAVMGQGVHRGGSCLYFHKAIRVVDDERKTNE